MKFSRIISNSFKYPFSGKELIFSFLLFVLAIILPLGFISDNNIVMILGLISLIIFIFILPGYMLSVVKNGTKESFKIPKVSLKKNFIDTLKLIVLDQLERSCPFQ